MLMSRQMTRLKIKYIKFRQCSWVSVGYIDDLDDDQMLEFWTLAGKAIHAMYIYIIKNKV